MGPAAVRFLLIVFFAFGGVSSTAAAGVQLDPAETLNSAVSTVTSQTGDVSDTTDSLNEATGDVTEVVNGAVDDVTGSVDDATGSESSGSIDSVTGEVTSILSGSSPSDADSSSTDSTSSSSGGTGNTSSTTGASSSMEHTSASNRGSPRTRFDRLPRRYEMLLEAPSSSDGVQAVGAGSDSRLSDDGENGGPGFVRTPLLPLPSTSSPAYWLLALLAVIASVLFLATRAPRHLLPAPMRGLVELRAPELSALAVTIGLVVAFGAALVIDALLL